MNLILLHDHEIDEEGHVVLDDYRARHVCHVIKPREGHTLKIGLLNGKLGRGTVEKLGHAHVVLRCAFDHDPPCGPDIDLLLALPRPKVLKRMLPAIAELGVRRLFLTHAEKVERNYFDTHWLQPEHYAPLLIKGLEQAGDTRIPEVRIVRRLKPFIEDDSETLFAERTCILAHPTAAASLSAMTVTTALPHVLALGPEGGWTDFEVRLFEDHGFTAARFGTRILSTHTACIALLSALHAMEG